MRALLLFSTLLYSSLVWSQEIVINPNITYSQRSVEQQNADVGDFGMLHLDFKSGYIFDFGLFAGLQLGYSTGDSKSGGPSTDFTAYQAGPSVGYKDKGTGLFATATYHLFGNAEFDTAGSPKVDYGKATGLQIDVGYPVQLTDLIHLGPQLSYRRLKYSDGNNGINDIRTKELSPYLGLWMYF